ncbi:MAG TPA: acyl-CoA thioesterase, partial [Ruminococcus sp.]|nr:acyl-CoA thioesterase [Ruminococcus sp.]
MLNEIYAYRRKAFYYETDKMGIVHHSNYIRWFEKSRVSLLEQAGLPFEAIEAQGVMVPVLSAECHYKFPVRFDEEFAVIPKI